MGEVLFTTNDVANILHVDKSTVKRWTDEGKLKCFRTPGGHRKFRSEDLFTFITDNNYAKETLQMYPQVMSDEMIIRSIVQKKEFNILQSVCFSAAIKGNKTELLQLFTETNSAGLSIGGIFDNILKPTTKKLNYMLSQNKLAVSEIHLAQNVLTSVIIQWSETMMKLPRNRKTIVCASIENGRNEIELTALITLFELNGYTVLNLGTGINSDSINQFVTRTKPFAVCLSASFTQNLEYLFVELKKVAEYSKINGAHCMASGDAYQTFNFSSLEQVNYFPMLSDLELHQNITSRSTISLK